MIYIAKSSFEQFEFYCETCGMLALQKALFELYISSSDLLIKMRLENAVTADMLERILSTYVFTMLKGLSDKAGIAKSNVASWLQRGQVPGNALVQWALDSWADIQWLVTGVFANANMYLNFESA